MAVKVIKDYYIKRKPKLMKNFSKSLEVAKDVLKSKFTAAKISEILIQMNAEYEKIIPEIPYIGGNKNSYTTLLVGGMSCLAMFRVLEKEGFTLREIGEFYYEYRDIHNTIRKKSLEKIGKDPAQYPFETVHVDYVKIGIEDENSKSLAETFDLIEEENGDIKSYCKECSPKRRILEIEI